MSLTGDASVGLFLLLYEARRGRNQPLPEVPEASTGIVGPCFGGTVFGPKPVVGSHLGQWGSGVSRHSSPRFWMSLHQPRLAPLDP